MYLDFYKLQAPPFQLTSDPRFFFAAPQYARALEDLSSDLAAAKGFRVITGEVGTGKTTLCHVMRADLERSNACVAQIVTTQIGPDDLLRMLSAQFGIHQASEEPGALLAGLRNFAIDGRDAGRRVVVFIDEAQNLPISAFGALVSLIDLEADGRPLMEIFLIGQPEFQRALASGALEQVRCRVASSHHLKPLGPEDTGSFIQHRLQTAGWRADPSFSEASYRLIYQLTGGVPRRINLFCHRLLIGAALKGLHRIDNGVVIQVLRDAQREGRPIGGLSFDEDVLSCDPDRAAEAKPENAAEAKPERSTSLPWARQAGPHPDANSGPAPTVARVEPERRPQQSHAAGPWPASAFERSATAVTSGGRGAARRWKRASRAALPVLVGLSVLLTAAPAGFVERAGDGMAGRTGDQVTEVTISLAETGDTKRPAPTGPAAPPAGSAAPSQTASTMAADTPALMSEARPTRAEGSPALSPPRAPVPLAATEAPPAPKSPAGQDGSFEAAAPSSEPRLALDSAAMDAALPGPEPPAGAGDLVPLNLVPFGRQADTTTQAPVPERASRPAAVEPPGPPDNAIPGTPAKTGTLEVRSPEPPPEAIGRVAQAPRMTLIDFVLTRKIVDREPADAVDSFAVADGRAFAFVRIKNPGPPTRISFVWYHGEAVRATIDLDIRTSTGWRTWSAVSLLPGSWRVELVSAGQVVLGERAFVVEP